MHMLGNSLRSKENQEVLILLVAVEFSNLFTLSRSVVPFVLFSVKCIYAGI